MGTTAQKLQAIQNSKAAIKAAIEAKGVSDVGDVLADYATKIGEISGGGGSAKYGMTIDSIFGDVDQNGALQMPSTSFSFSSNDIVSIPDYGLYYKFYKNTALTSVNLPSLSSVGNYGLQNAFNGCTSLTSVDLSSLTSITGNNGMQQAFAGCTSLTSVDLSSLTSITGGYGLYYGFQNCTSLTTVDLSKVTSVGNQGLYYAFGACTSLTTVDLSSLTSVGNGGLQYAFGVCTSLTTVYLSSLSSVGNGGLNSAFSGCTHLELVDFSQATAVPALNSTNTFQNTNNYYRIVVPNALYDQWIAATNWSDPSIVTHIEKAIKAVSFKAGAANSTVTLTAVGTPTSIDIEYSTDSGTTFSPYTVGTTVTLSSVDDTVLFRAGSTGQTALADDSSNYHKFVMTGSISVDDSLVWLFNRQGTEPQTLDDYAFYGLFNGCSALQNAPELPFTSLGDYSYAYMFAGCTGLTTPPALPATTLGDYCYSNMFNGCTGLTTAPTLANTSLTEGCYEGMFKGCTSITEAPTLPATTLATGCYNEMFYGCSALNNIKLSYTGNFSTTYFNDWVYGVAASGTFVYFGNDTTRGTSAIPAGWTVNDWIYDGLTFRAEQAGSTLKFAKAGTPPTVTVQYTTDGITWQDYTIGSTITLANVGDKVGFIAKTTNNGFSNSNSSYHVFQGTGQLSVSGNINSLLDRNNYRTITDISTVSNRVFNWMFYGMTSLVSAEDLTFPATKIGQFAYNNMFQDCTNMTKAPKEIAATTVTSSNWPMAGMFKGCTSLTKSPYLRFTSVDSSTAFQEMFQNCSNLNEIKLDYTGSFGNGTWTNWVSGVAASGTFYYNGSYTGRGTNAIPNGWTITPFSA